LYEKLINFYKIYLFYTVIFYYSLNYRLVSKVLLGVVLVTGLISTHAEAQGDDICYDNGFSDGQDGVYIDETWEQCNQKGEFAGDSYYFGYVDGCKDAGGTEETCNFRIFGE
jgi:hypothetical protein